MSDLNDLSKPVTTDTEPNVLDTIRAHIVRAITWTGYSATANKVAGMMSAVTAAVSGGRSLRLYRRNDANTTDEEVVTLPAISVGGNAATASAAQPGSALETAINAKAPLASPAFSGTPTVPTASAGTNSTQAASTAFVATAVANVVNTAPAALDTLNELAAALGNDPNFATSMSTALGNRVTKTSSNRPGVTRLYRRDDDSDYSIQVNWTGGRWRLRGYSADSFHAEAEVSYADTAGSAPASDVYSWAKQVSKPGYTKSEVGLSNVDNTADSAKSVAYAAQAGSAATATSATTAATAASCTGNAATATLAANGVSAWVNFDSTNGPSGNINRRAYANVSSVTYNSVGIFTVTFASALPSANYVVSITLGGGNAYSFRTLEDVLPRTTTSFRFVTMDNTVNPTNPVQVNVSVFGG